MYLAFLSVENSGSQGAIMDVAQKALDMNPECLRIVEVMCAETGPGMLNELADSGPQIYSGYLAGKLEGMPSFPKRISDQIEQYRQAGGNPTGRETICQELIGEGAPERDKVEPSWAALGRMVQETTFAHIQRKANLIAVMWGVDASDYVASVQPFIGGHPFKFLIDAYGAKQGASSAKMREMLAQSEPILRGATLRQITLYWLMRQVGADSPDARDYWWRMWRDSDSTSFDIEALLNYGSTSDDNWECLKKASPRSPMLVVTQIQDAWNGSKVGEWESEYGDYPSVALALGKKFTELKQWDNAVHSLRRYITMAPDYVGYEALAAVYKAQNQDQMWLATLNEYLRSGVDYGLQDSLVEEEIAYYYMNKKQYAAAVPYADAAAETASGPGLICAADAHTYTENWDIAEQYLVNEKDHYSDDPIRWVIFCSRTGRGDLAGARAAEINYVAQKPDGASSEDMLRLGCIYMGMGDRSSAVVEFEKRMKLKAGPLSAMHLAILEDEMGDKAARDRALKKVESMPERTTPLGRMAELLEKAFKAGPAAMLDAGAIDAILKDDVDVDQRVAVCALAGRYLEDRGQMAGAVGYYKRCYLAPTYDPDRFWVDTRLRAAGVEPWTLIKAAMMAAAN
jgi:tetratricopeptide (TPR) repeat protein